MKGSGKLVKSLVCLVILLSAFSPSLAQKKSKNEKSTKSSTFARPVIWERVNIREQDLFWGPGGTRMRPNLSRITLIKEEKGGASKKYRIEDGSGREWIAKIDPESQAETAAVRLLYALGYKTEINYLVPRITIPGKGTFSNVRLEARPENVDREERWKWNENPFVGTNELQGLKIMMAFLNNWDLKNPGNNITLLTDGRRGKELHYVVSDLGATFGKTGNSKIFGPLSFIFWRFTRSKNNPGDYSRSKFIDEVEEDGYLDLAYGGRNTNLLEDISVSHGRWLANLLNQLSNKQIEDAFRAANYTPAEIRVLSQAVKNRIRELDRTTRQFQAVR
ncbi:MAG: hypothetical protein M3209_09130 [Acidobacteriota bacterium]|nr:hypothetical protein [Acidobacteriota bacterium]